MTGRRGGDGFLRGVHACDGLLHLLFFLRENPRRRISPPLVFGDGFLRGARACLTRPSGRLCFTKSQWDRSLGPTFCSSRHFLPNSDTCNTIDNHNAGVSPSASLTTLWRCNLQPRLCCFCCNANLVPDWGKTDGVKSESRSVLMAKSNVAAVADVLKNPPTTCPCLAASVWQAPNV